MSDDKAFTYGGSDAFYDELFKASPIGIMILDQQGRLVHANEACMVTLGLSDLDSLIGFDVFKSGIIPDSQKKLLDRKQKIRFETKLDLAKCGLATMCQEEVELSFRVTPVDSGVADDQGGYLVQLRDVSSRKHAERSLLQRFEAEKLINMISSRLFRATRKTVDAELNHIICEIAAFTRMDRAYMVLPRRGSSKMDCRHEWHRNGLVSVQKLFSDMSRKKLHWIFDRLAKGPVFISNVDEIKNEDIGDFEKIFQMSTRSVLIVPLDLPEGRGFIGFDSVKSSNFWDSSMLGMVEMAAGMISNVVTRLFTQNTLEALNEQFSLFMENLPVGAFIRKLDGNLVYINRALKNFLGLDAWRSGGAEELKLPVQFSENLDRHTPHALESGPAKVLQTFADDKGNHRTGEMILFPLRGNEGEVFVGGILRDLSDVQTLEKDLAGIKNRFIQAMSLANMGWWEFDYSGETIKVTLSQELKKICELDMDQDTWQSDDMMWLLHPAEKEMILDNYHAAMQNHMPFRMIHRMITPKGRTIYVQERGQGVYDETGQLLSSFGMCQDVTDQITAHQKVQYQRELISNLVNSMPMAVIGKEFKGAGEYVIFNSAARELSGMQPSDIVGKSDENMLSGETLELWQKLDTQTILSGTAAPFDEMKLEFASGKQCTVSGVKVPIYDLEGNASMMITLLDGGKQKDGLLSGVQEANLMRIFSLGNEFVNFSQFTLDLAHDLAADFTDPQHVKKIETIQHVAESACQWAHGTIETGELKLPDYAPVKLGDMKNWLERVLDIILGPGSVEMDIPDDLPPVSVISPHLAHMIINLCKNAHRAMNEKGRVKVAASLLELAKKDKKSYPQLKPGKWVCISVEDNGCGMAPEMLDRIFEPYFSIYRREGSVSPVGLGLTIIKTILDNYGGFIDVESQLGKGSLFTMFLPADTDIAPSAAPAAEPEPQKKMTVLFAEDDELVRNLIRHYFSSAGYDVIVAKDGQEAIDLFDRHKSEIDILVLDVIMPRKNGKEVYDHVMISSPEMPVVFCSGYSDSILQSEYLLSVPGRLLHKPCPPVKLLTAVRESLVAKKHR